MEFFYFIPDIRKRILKKIIIKAAFVETGFHPFNPKKVLNKLPSPPKGILKKDPLLMTINIIILKTLKQVSNLT